MGRISSLGCVVEACVNHIPHHLFAIDGLVSSEGVRCVYEGARFVRRFAVFVDGIFRCVLERPGRCAQAALLGEIVDVARRDRANKGHVGNDDAVGRGGSGLVSAGVLVEPVHQEHRSIAVFDRNRGIVACGASGAVDVGHVLRGVFPAHAVAIGGIQRSGITPRRFGGGCFGTCSMGCDELLAFAAQGKHARDLQNVIGRFRYLGCLCVRVAFFGLGRRGLFAAALNGLFGLGRLLRGRDNVDVHAVGGVCGSGGKRQRQGHEHHEGNAPTAALIGLLDGALERLVRCFASGGVAWRAGVRCCVAGRGVASRIRVRSRFGRAGIGRHACV